MGKFIDLTGEKYSKLTVVSYEGKDNTGRSIWKCKCDCGNEKNVRTQDLRSGHVRSCGCLYKSAEDLTGKRFGYLTVIKRVEDKVDRSGRKYITWLCKCDCGNTTYVTSQNLRGKTTSCGCYLKSVAGKQTLKHGYRKTRLYRIYNGMKQRCNNKKCQAYKNYGGRGIKVCDEWNKSDGLKEFAEWALKNGYSENLTLERNDVNGDYSPDNCSWIPLNLQAKNTRRNVIVRYNDEDLILSDFAGLVGINHRIVSKALKEGMNVDEIIERYSR